MELPPAPPLSAAAPPHHGYPDSLDSSPRSRNSWDESLYSSVPGAVSKLRMMCSYGGHIVPRPHNKSLCYVGGDTRIVVVDRRTTLSDFIHRLSKNLRHTQSFILKYQLPNEDLDSLITITTDEDLENMIDEYDRLGFTTAAADPTKNNSNKSSHLRLFLFPSKPDSVSSIGSLIGNSTKSQDWFLNALNGATSGFLDSSSVNCLLSFDDDTLIGSTVNSLVKDEEPHILSTPDSLMVEMTSSSSSASSSPPVASLPPVRAHGEDQKVGFEEQLAQMSVVAKVQRQDGGGFVGRATPKATPMSYAPVIGDYQNRVFSDDERSEQGMIMGNRKQLQTAQLHDHSESVPLQLLQQKQTCGFDLPSPDSVSSDGSTTNPLSRQKPIIYQEPIVQIQSAQSSRSTTNPIEPNITDSNTRILQDYGYLLPTQFDPQLYHQQQFIQSGTQYIPNHPTRTVPISSYYPIYPQKQHHIHNSALDHQHQYNPVYYVPAKQAQPYSEAAPAPKPEIGSVPYRTATTGALQYVGFSQMNLSGNAIYAPEFSEPMQPHLYYTRALEPQFVASHQPTENVKQQVRTTSQP